MFLKKTKWKPVRLCVYTHQCVYDSMGTALIPIPVINIGAFCDTVHRGIYVSISIGAFVDAMCTARILIPIINLGSFLWYGALVPHKDTRTSALIRPMGIAQIPRPIRTAPCIVSPTPGLVLLFSLTAWCILLRPPRCVVYWYALVRSNLIRALMEKHM